MAEAQALGWGVGVGIRVRVKGEGKVGARAFDERLRVRVRVRVTVTVTVRVSGGTSGWRPTNWSGKNAGRLCAHGGGLRSKSGPSGSAWPRLGSGLG